MTLLLLQWSNYFNRIISKKNTIEEYIGNAKYKYLENTNFNPNDGVNTTHIINWREEWTPDYCIIIDDFNNIVSRWYIVENVRTCKEQYRISLKRDSVADFYDQVITAPCFIEKGTITDVTNPLLLNSEGLRFNQIKKNEFLVTDKTKISWLTVYYDKSAKDQLTGTFSLVDPADIGAIELGTTLEQSPIYKHSRLSGTDFRYFSKATNIQHLLNLSAYWQPAGQLIQSSLFQKSWAMDESGLNILDYYHIDNRYLVISGFSSLEEEKQYIYDKFRSSISTLNGLARNDIEQFNEVTYEQLMSYKDKIIHTYDNKYYKVKIIPYNRESEFYLAPQDTPGHNTLYNAYKNIIQPGGQFIDHISGTMQPGVFLVKASSQEYSVVFEELFDYTGTYDFTGIEQDVSDAPYGVIQLPYIPCDPERGKYYWLDYYSEDEESVIATNITGYSRISMAIVNDLIERLSGSGKIYDVQLLPFNALCTNISRYEDTSSGWLDLHIDLSTLDLSQYITVKAGAGQTPKCFAIIPNSIKFTFNYENEDIGAEESYFGYALNEAEKKKISNECDLFRLVSPNFNGIYEFSKAKNNMDVTKYNIDVTLKPYIPYIHINPFFAGLYGSDFNDPRGLICGGDFSLSKINDQWQTYVQNNKNYQNIFDRQIENMDVMHNYDQFNQIIGSITGSASGASMGAIAGGLPGAIAGGVMSLAGGIADYALAESKYNIQKDYLTDIHNYQLDNVKALANSLTKVDSFNNNNKIFPIVEYISCTDEEKKALIEKLSYDGMTIGRIGKIQDYMGKLKFIKGQIIRLYDFNEDSHLANDIYNEISKGVYL